MKIGIVAGAFDLLHTGHILMMKEAKEVCDYLICALHVDPSLERATKNKPIQSVYERFIQLEAVKYIDEIIPYETENELFVILLSKNVNIRILGGDYVGNNFTGDELVYSQVMEVHFCKRSHSYSTSELRNRIQNEKNI